MKGKIAVYCSILLLLVGSGILAGFGEHGTPATSAYAAEMVKTSPVGSVSSPDTPVSNGFTYQGRLKSGGTPASGQYDFTFNLYDNPSTGSPVATVVTQTNVTVQDGLFATTLDFGTTAFNGEGRWLQIAVRTAGVGLYTTLWPRQPITPAPYALFALKTQGYKNVVTVAKSGGDYTSIQQALNGITGNSAIDRYLVWVAPGTYTETVTMKQWVDIEGSGERQTVIISSGSVTDTIATVIGASGAELRSLSVANTGGAAYSIGVRNNSTAPTLRNVTVTAGGGTTRNIGVYNLNFTAPTMAEVTIDVDGLDNSYSYGVFNDNYSAPSMTEMTILVSGWTNTHNRGVYNHNYSSPTMTDVNIQVSGGDGLNGSSTSAAVDNDLNSSANMTDLTVDVSGGGGTSYALGIRSFEGSSLTMNGGTITTREATFNFGVYANGGSGSVIDMNGVTVSATGPVGSVNFAAYLGNLTFNAGGTSFTASGGYQARAMLLEYGALANLNGAILRASGASDINYGLYLAGGSAMVHASDIAAEGQIGARQGLFLYYNNFYNSHVTVDSSKVKGATNSIYHAGDSLDYIRVAASKLEGGPVISNGIGPVTCAGVHDENYAFFTSTCP